MQVYGDRTMNQRDDHGEIKHYRYYANIGAALYHEQTQVNYLVQECVSQGERVRQEVIPVLNLPTTTFDIASIVSDDASRPNRKIFFQLRNERSASSINLMSNIMEPLCYPQLFPYGEKGWELIIENLSNSTNIFCIDFYSRESDYYSLVLND